MSSSYFCSIVEAVLSCRASASRLIEFQSVLSGSGRLVTFQPFIACAVHIVEIPVCVHLTSSN